MAYGLYVHVPFCSTRCGYCDFNTYTPDELTRAGDAPRPGNTIDGYLSALEAELDMAAQHWDLGSVHSGRHRSGEEHFTGVNTVFFGGGTPSLLGHEGLNRALRAIQRTVGLAPGAEVTTESNPESTSPEFFERLREGGFTRVSLGMQSAAGHVLKVLERRHTPGRPVEAAREAHAAGFEHVNLDLIYGTPTETDDDLKRSVDAVLSADVDHVSAYSLIVEDGTAMARKVRRGELPRPDEDVLADRYQMIDSVLNESGMSWYEVSNWSRPGGECEHNLIYWRGGQWWGAGPGAHGCVHLRPGVDGAHDGLTRMVNAKHPARYYRALIEEHGSPVTHTEQLSSQDVYTERIMLGLRLKEGLDLSTVYGPRGANSAGAERVASEIEKYERLGLLNSRGGRVALTLEGRYLADGIVTDILLAQE